jgi:hypothetical protein
LKVGLGPREQLTTLSSITIIIDSRRT